MIRMAILGSAAALAMSLPAAAQQYGYDGYGYDNGYNSYGYQDQSYYNRTNCDAQRRSNQTAGGLIGAVAGGLLGAAIADDGDKNRHHRRHRYSRYDRGYYGYRGHRGYRGHHRGNDNGDQVAGAVIGAIVGGVAGTAIAGNSTDCTTRAYGPQTQQRYGTMNVAPPTRDAYGRGWNENRAYQTGYQQDPVYDVRPGEELYGGSSYDNNPAWSDPSYGATTTGYNAGYSAPQNTGECRTVYRGSQPATACNVGGDRWEFVD